MGTYFHAIYESIFFFANYMEIYDIIKPTSSALLKLRT